MSPALPAEDLVGRDHLVQRVGRFVGVSCGRPAAMLVSGEAGIGKSSMLRAAAALAVERGALVAWGTCLDVEGAPGYWPWTQALEGLVQAVGVERVRAGFGEGVDLLASIVPSLGQAAPGDRSDRDRLLAMDSVHRLLEALAADRPILLVLDDLQWADDSSLALLELVVGAPRQAAVGVIGAYRHDELPPAVAPRLAVLAARGEHLHLGGLDVDGVQQLMDQATGRGVDRAVAEVVHRRTGGHPFFVRELALGDPDASTDDPMPLPVRASISRRVSLLPEHTVAVLEVMALCGGDLLPDVAAAALDRSIVEVDVAVEVAVEAGVVVRTEQGARFAHDLLREATAEQIDPAHRVEQHRRIGTALEARRARGGPVATSALARHFTAAIPVAGSEPAVRWALAAAADECHALAFDEAAGHLRRLRTAVADAGIETDPAQLVEVLLAEVDALARAGRTADARELVHLAAGLAPLAGRTDLVASVALASAQLGARFAVRRDEVVRELEAAVDVVAGADDLWEARLTAALARELQHSVAEDRPRAAQLSEAALELGRRTDDPGTHLMCLLARHDVLWVPGQGGPRAEVAQEIIAVALAAGSSERHAEGLLLLANAQLEQGSPAFKVAMDACIGVLDQRGELRHRYVAETRRACLALLRGRLDEADDLIERAAALGARIREPDTGNVRMSQRLELVRARGDLDELRAFATEAVEHWTGAPVHAHGVAAGFLARCGDLDAARSHVAAVVDLGTWRADRSYLWSVFVRELAEAAIALEDQELARLLLEDVEPLTGSCGVNGAVVAFAGCHAQTAGRLAGSLGRAQDGRRLLLQAAEVYRRLGASGWLAQVEAQVEAASDPSDAGSLATSDASMRRDGALWHLTFAGRSATVAQVKGLDDIARLIKAGGEEIHALDLVGAMDRSGRPGEVTDRSALDAYRLRLADLDADIEEAEGHCDLERRAQAEAERQALLDELGRATGVGNQPRQFANHPAERARKAVTARVRDAIRKLEPVHPELAAHLERTVVTGTYCRHRPDGIAWAVET